MSFADNVRKNFNPPAAPKPDPQALNRLAVSVVEQMKQKLMANARAGKTAVCHPGLGIVKKKCVEATWGVAYDPKYTPKGQTVIRKGEDEDYPVAHDRQAARALADLMEPLCRQEGILMEFRPSSTGAGYIFRILL